MRAALGWEGASISSKLQQDNAIGVTAHRRPPLSLAVYKTQVFGVMPRIEWQHGSID
jgi:hypothetical protein